MRRSYKLRSQISKQTSQCHFRYYVIYTLGSMLLVLFLYICYDVATRNYKSALQANSQCTVAEIRFYNTLVIPFTVNAINKTAQLMLFFMYLYYTYQLSKDISDAGVSNDQQSLLHKIASVMGAVIGLPHILHVFSTVFHLDPVWIFIAVAGCFLLQQCLIVVILLCSKKVRNLHGECLSKS